ncbi:MAG: universal stress protein [Pseudomonadota bacterium]
MQECKVSYKRVMAPLDLSSFSEPTFQHAYTLAKALGADLVLLNVINSRGLEALDKLAAEGYAVSRERYVETVLADRKTIFEREFLPLAEGVKVNLLFKVGLPYDEIIKTAKEENIDLIVMGTKGRSNLVGTLFGTTAEKVFRRAPCPVVSVRGPEHCRV